MRFNSILHIDDDFEDRNIFRVALREVAPNLAYCSFGDAKEALQALRDKQVNADVIFVDLNMPVMNGQEFLVEIKKDTVLRTIPVVIFTTSSHKATIELVKDLGAKEFITKPDTYSELVSVLASFFNDAAGSTISRPVSKQGSK